MSNTNPTEIHPTATPSAIKTAGASGKWIYRLFRLLLPLVVLAAGGFATYWMLETSPHAKPRPKHRSAALVEVKPIKFENKKTMITAMGTAVPSKEISLNSQVNGEVLETGINFLPGGVIQNGEFLLKIDPTEYELAVRQAASDVADVKTRLKLEKGQQLVAEQEFSFLKQNVSNEEKDLILRKPQLESLQASLESARAKLEKAKLDLSRTRIHAPFNAVIRSTHVNTGARATTAGPLATLAGTDTFWIEVLVPVNQLKWIRIPGNGSKAGANVRIFDPAAWGEGVFRKGQVIRLLPGLEEQGRMAKLLVSIKDPLDLLPGPKKHHRVLINAYVKVEIEGIGLAKTAVIERGHIRDGEYIWIMNDSDQLEIRKVDIAFKDRKNVYVTGGIREGERLLISDLPTPVSGMMLRTGESMQAAPPETAHKGKNADGKKGAPK